MKLAWIIAEGPGHQAALDRLDLVADTYLSVATPVQLALPQLLTAGDPFVLKSANEPAKT